MFKKNTIIIGAIFGALAVALGAFGAHALKNVLSENQRTETYELAVRYQFYHTLALLALAAVYDHLHANKAGWARLAFIIGIIVFSGSLYILSLTGITVWGAVTPIGGVSLIAGWILFAWAAVSRK
ncbi:MAG: DUF423 domain-containing protein [Cyclobacteriaceae bacterium]